MATGTATRVVHWAYMTRLKGKQELPPVTAESLNGSLRAEQWKWLRGTLWDADDATLFADGAILSVAAFRNGYFWGDCCTADLEMVRFLGSVTPEGDLYILFSVDNAPAVARSGVILGTEESSEMIWAEPGGQTILGGATLLP